MKRTQIYLDEKLWRQLQKHAKRENTTASDLIRKTLREKYIDEEARRKAMLAFAGIWKDRTDLPDTETYISELRGRRSVRRATA